MNPARWRRRQARLEDCSARWTAASPRGRAACRFDIRASSAAKDHRHRVKRCSRSSRTSVPTPSSSPTRARGPVHRVVAGAVARPRRTQPSQPGVAFSVRHWHRHFVRQQQIIFEAFQQAMLDSRKYAHRPGLAISASWRVCWRRDPARQRATQAAPSRCTCRRPTARRQRAPWSRRRLEPVDEPAKPNARAG